MSKKFFFLFVSCWLGLEAFAQNPSAQSMLEKTKGIYASLQNLSLQYQFYQKFRGKLDTTLYEVHLKSHAATGKLRFDVYNTALPEDAPSQKHQFSLKKKGAKDLYVVLKMPKDDILYGSEFIRYGRGSRYYEHLPIVNTKFLDLLSKTATEVKETPAQFIVKSPYYVVHINRQTHWVEEIWHNNQKSDIENVWEHIVIKNQQHNLKELEDLTQYDLVPPKGANQFSPKETFAKGEAVPEWECADVSSDKTIKLSDYKNKVVILDFWNTSCGSCVAFLPKMEALQKEFEGKEVVFIGMAWDKMKENIIKHLEKFAGGVFYTNVLVSEKELEAYKWQVMPTFYVLDKNHKVLHLQEGTKNAYENLKKAIEEGLK